MFRLTSLRRRSLIALFAVLLAFQSLGWLMGWYVARQEVRWTMRRAMQEGRVPVRHLTLLAADLPAIRVDEREIKLGNQRYDIYFQEIIGDSVRLAICRDAPEERLFEVLNSLLGLSERSASGPVSPLSAWWIKWFEAEFLRPAQSATPRWAFTEPWPVRRFFKCLLPEAQASPACFSPPPEAA